MRPKLTEVRRRGQLENASASLDVAEAACGLLLIRLRQFWRRNPKASALEISGIERELSIIVDGILDGHEIIRTAMAEDRDKARRR